MNKKSIFKWEIIGFFIITIVGSLFHFCFEWSGGLKPVAFFCAVNESVWEHTKMGFWPAVFYAVVEYFAFGRNKKNFIIAKTLAFYLIPLVIIAGFYTMEAVIGKHTVWLDIALFIVSLLISQCISFRIITAQRDYSRYKGVFLVLLILILAAYSLFTFFPPELELFKNPKTGGYGIP